MPQLSLAWLGFVTVPEDGSDIFLRFFGISQNYLVWGTPRLLSNG
jgi:hypothetical protein